MCLNVKPYPEDLLVKFTIFINAQNLHCDFDNSLHPNPDICKPASCDRIRCLSLRVFDHNG